MLLVDYTVKIAEGKLKVNLPATLVNASVTGSRKLSILMFYCTTSEIFSMYLFIYPSIGEILFPLRVLISCYLRIHLSA
jgi:hypothetical protein